MSLSEERVKSQLRGTTVGTEEWEGRSRIPQYRFMEKALKPHEQSQWWKRLHRASPQAQHTAIVAIKQSNLDKLESLLYAVSDPKSKLYGKHWSRAQVSELTANPVAVAAVTRYMSEHGFTIVGQSVNSEYITVQGNISHWESFLGTIFHSYVSHQGTQDNSNQYQLDDSKTEIMDNIIYRAEEYFIPFELENHIEMILNVVHLPLQSVIKPRLHALDR